MNKLTFTVAIIFLWSIQVIQAQGLYMGLKVGYAFSAAGGTVGSDHHTIKSVSNGVTTSNIDTHSPVKGSYGEGIVPTLQIGYMFSKYLGAELGISYLFGRRFGSVSIVDANLYSNNNPTPVIENNTVITRNGSQSFYLNPALVVRLPGETKFIPYAKLGLFIGLINKMSSDITSTGSYTYNYGLTGLSSGSGTGSSNTYPCVGFTATLGTDYMISKNVSLFAEANLVAASLFLKDYNSSSSFEEHNRSGTYHATRTYNSHAEYVDQLTTDHSNDNNPKTTPVTGDGIKDGSITTTTYSDGTTETITSINYTNGNNSFSSDKTQKTTSSSLPLNSVGISIGIRYFFGK